MRSMKNKSTTHQLAGLEADNLLAFLALLGLLRALENERSQWNPRAHWEGEPYRVVLTLQEEVCIGDLLTVADEGIGRLGRAFNFDEEKNIAYSLSEFRELCVQNREDAEVLRALAAMGSDGTGKKSDLGKIEVTPYCAMFGQGHQHFLERLRKMTVSNNPPDTDMLARTLFHTWDYADKKTFSFRWDPREDQRHALQFGDPSESKNKIGTMTGANRLAAVGFCTLTAAPVRSRLATLGVFGQRKKNVCWPLPVVPTSMSGYLALLGHPDMETERRAKNLAVYGVSGIARAGKIQVGKYFNFERAIIQRLDASEIAA